PNAPLSSRGHLRRRGAARNWGGGPGQVPPPRSQYQEVFDPMPFHCLTLELSEASFGAAPGSLPCRVPLHHSARNLGREPLIPILPRWTALRAYQFNSSG